MDIGNKIVQLREENQMSQTELAELLDVSRQTVSKWERNVCEPEAKRIVQLAKIFHITTDYLLGNERELRHQSPQAIVKSKWDREKCKEKILKVKTEIVNKVKADPFFYVFLGCLALALLTWWLAWMYSRAHPVVLPNPDGPVYTGLKAHLLGEQWYETKLLVAVSCASFVASIVFFIIKACKSKKTTKTKVALFLLLVSPLFPIILNEIPPRETKAEAPQEVALRYTVVRTGDEAQALAEEWGVPEAEDVLEIYVSSAVPIESNSTTD